MRFRHAAFVMCMSAGVCASACGARQTPRPNGDANKPSAAGTASPLSGSIRKPDREETAEADVTGGKTAADHHRDFMAGCAKKAINSPDYCECAWGEFRKVFTDEDMSSGDMPPVMLEKAKSQVVGACSAKIPEDIVKDGFLKGCVGENPSMKPYCECSWTEFRKRFSAGELGDDGTIQSERFLAARATVVKACGSKMPESVSKDAFMKGCAKDPSSDKFCGCAWKELRKQASPAEIEAGTFDPKTVFARVEKSCASLRPPATK